MKPQALRVAIAFALFYPGFLSLQAQIKTARYEVLPVQSGVYRQAVNVYVYTTPAAPGDAVALPVVYVPLAAEKDRAAIARLEDMMQQGTLPRMRIVGIERSARLVPVRETAPAVYVDPKGKDEAALSDDEWFGRFVSSEVVPAVEAKYRCNFFKVVYVDESTPLGKQLLASRSGGYSAYLTPTPFVWFNGAGRQESAQSFQSYYAGLQAKETYLMAAELDGYMDELFLKAGRLPRIKE